jgi:uncharacterized protein
MNARRLGAIALATVLLGTLSAAPLHALNDATSAGAPLPKYTGYVNDFSGLLPADARAQLETLLRAVEDATTAEIAVAIVPSLDGLSVEDYANKLFREWGVGKEDVDNGVLVLVAPDAREMRIEVGYGLEPVLPDALAGDIIRTNFLPHFREDRYVEGITEGVTRVADVVRRNHVLTAAERHALEDAASDEPTIWLIVPFFGMFIGIGFFMAGVGLASKTGMPVLFGTFFAGMPFLMSLLFKDSVFVLGPLAVAALAYGWHVGRRRPDWVREMRKSGGHAGTSGWVMGASANNSGGSTSGSRSSGGSSFGGGSSGGGGASGRW